MLNPRTVRISEDDYHKACAVVIHEIIHDEETPEELKMLESMVALRVTVELKDKLFDK